MLPMKLSKLFLPAILTIVSFNLGCKKDNNDQTLLVHQFAVENIVAPGGSQSATNKCFLNLYDGIAYTKAEAEAQSSKVDFAYNYKGDGCNSCRFFENVTNMSTRTWYVESFSTITNSTLEESEEYGYLTLADFDAIQSANDLEKIFEANPRRLFGSGDITNRETDVATNRVFAFVDKDGRKGVFKIGDYTANVPAGDKATLQLTVKIAK